MMNIFDEIEIINKLITKYNEEIENIQDINSKVVSLGPRILRTETASVVASSIVLYELSDLGGNI